jgi:hypothetical protein
VVKADHYQIAAVAAVFERAWCANQASMAEKGPTTIRAGDLTAALLEEIQALGYSRKRYVEGD